MSLNAVNSVPGGNATEDFENSAVELKPTAHSYRMDFKGLSFFDLSLLTLNICTNFYIFLVICIKRKYRKRTNFLIANLALASMVYNAVFVVRKLEAHFQPAMSYYHVGLCGIFAVMHRIPMSVMSMTTMAISLERSHSAFAAAPLQSIPSRTWTALKVVTIWSVSILITLPAALTNVLDPSATITSVRKCKKVLLYSRGIHLGYVAIHVAVVFVIPTAVLVAELWRMRAKLRFLVWREDKRTTCRTDERLRLVRNACIFTALFIIFWVPIGLHLTLYDMPNEILEEKWKNDNLVSLRGLQCMTNYFILSLPVLLFMMNDGLRESLCRCLSTRSEPIDKSVPCTSLQSWNRYYHDLCCFYWCPICCFLNQESTSTQLSTL